MIRFLNVVACLALLGSAIYAYSIKYQTLYHAEQIAKMKRQIDNERNVISMQRAEWAFLTRPDRIQPLADKYLNLQPTAINQLVGFAALPEREQKVDAIGRKLEDLGLGAPTNTPPSATSATPGGAR
jgi:cell division protein FtsL